MASIERTAYPRFKSALSLQELHTLYDPTDEEREFAMAHTRGAAEQLTFLTLLKSHQYLGYLPAVDDVPLQIRSYLDNQPTLPADTGVQDTKHYRSRYRQLIRSYLA